MKNNATGLLLFVVAALILLTFQNCGGFQSAMVDMGPIQSSSLPAVGSAGDTPATPTPTATPTPSPTPATSGPTPSPTPNIVGTWAQGCTPSTGGYSQTNTYTFKADGTASNVSLEYQDGSCGSLAATSNSTGTYTISGPVSTPSGAYTLSFIVTNSTLTSASDLVSFGMGWNNVCGISDWSTGVATNVLGMNCYGVVVGSQYNIFSVSGSTLYLGQTGDPGTSTDGTSATQLPTTLQTVPYQKQ